MDEARHFLIALERGLFRIDDEGTAKSESFAHSVNSHAEQILGPIFAVTPSPPRLIRENVCQLATASMLVLERGWLPSQIRVQPDYAISSGIDAIIESAGGRMLAAIEIKRSAHELQKFTSDFRRCCQRGEHAKADCAFQQNHDTFEFCRHFQPPYLWIVAPEADVCYELIYRSAMIEMNELDTLPPRSHIEFGLEQSGA